jgi:inositol transporter-like SP family MFS transporter
MGFFMPYIYETVGGISNAAANGLQVGLYLTSAVSTLLIFMRLADRHSRRGIYFTMALLFTLAWCVFLLPSSSLSTPFLIVFALFVGLNNGSGQQTFSQLWAGEIFPARYRASAQGALFFSARIFLGLWSLVLPKISESFGFRTAAVCLVIFARVSLLIGTIFTPDTSGKTLERIELERYGSVGTTEAEAKSDQAESAAELGSILKTEMKGRTL